MRTQLTAEFAALADTEGTFQNTSRHAVIEIATSTTKNTGIVLRAGETRSIKSDDTLYARVAEVSDNTETVYLAHEPFKLQAGGGDASVMTGATASADGKAGLVPKPLAGEEAHILTGAGTWAFPAGCYNKKETFTTSGTFTAPVTGTYKITLQGGGGGGGGTTGWSGGGGGGSGAKIETYEKLIAGVSYSYTVADRTSAAAVSSNGDNGGDTSITVNGNAYIAGGGYGGYKGTATIMGCGGQGGEGKINGVLVSVGAPGGSPNIISGGLGVASSIIHGGPGGGDGGGQIGFNASYPHPVGVSTNGSFGGGGQGGSADGSTPNHTANRGGAGYISFEYYDPTV